MKPPPEDGSLEEITSSGLNPEINVIIIQRPDEIKEPGETTYTLATFDRTKEGEEWPGDQVLEKLIPELPKVKAPKVSKPEVTVKTNTALRHRVRRKSNQKPVKKDNNLKTIHRPKPPYKKFRSERSINSSLVKNIDPWVFKPWENQASFSGINTSRSVNTTSLTSEVPFNNFQSQLLPPGTNNNIYKFNNSAYERNIRPAVASNIPFLNNHIRPPTANRMPTGPCPSFLPPVRFNWPSNRGFCGPCPAPNVDFNGPTQNDGLFGETPIARYNVKHGLLGPRPFLRTPYTTTLLPRNEENVGDKNSFISNAKNSSGQIGSYDASYGRIPRTNFDNYTDVNEISVRDSHGSYEHPNSTDDSRNDSFRDTSETNYSRFLNSGSSVNNYENQYRNSYEHLDHNYPNDNNKNISLKTPRDSYKTNYGEFKKLSVGVNHYESNYVEVGNDNLYKNNYNESQVSNIQETSFMNNQGRNPNEESFMHVNDSTAAYSQEDFQNNGYLASAANSSTPRSNLNLAARSNVQNIHVKNTQGPNRKWTTYKYTNTRRSRIRDNREQQRFRNWRTSQK